MTRLIYFSNVSENTHRFVQKLDEPGVRLPIRAGEPEVMADEEFVLIVPTYGGGVGERAVPKPVQTFLNHQHNRQLLRGVIAGGNRNFGTDYCLAGRIIAHKTGVPLLHRFEIIGLPSDVTTVNTEMETLWNS